MNASTHPLPPHAVAAPRPRAPRALRLATLGVCAALGACGGGGSGGGAKPATALEPRAVRIDALTIGGATSEPAVVTVNGAPDRDATVDGSFAVELAIGSALPGDPGADGPARTMELAISAADLAGNRAGRVVTVVIEP